MTVSVQRNSRLRFGSLRIVGTTECWDFVDLPPLPEQQDDILYQVMSNDRIDVMAYKFYGDSNLWWIIAAANDLEILPTQLNMGGVLRIPSPRYVTTVLFGKNVRRR
jgi:hypothetical protein